MSFIIFVGIIIAIVYYSTDKSKKKPVNPGNQTIQNSPQIDEYTHSLYNKIIDVYRYQNISKIAHELNRSERQVINDILNFQKKGFFRHIVLDQKNMTIIYPLKNSTPKKQSIILEPAKETPLETMRNHPEESDSFTADTTESTYFTTDAEESTYFTTDATESTYFTTDIDSSFSIDFTFGEDESYNLGESVEKWVSSVSNSNDINDSE